MDQPRQQHAGPPVDARDRIAAVVAFGGDPAFRARQLQRRCVVPAVHEEEQEGFGDVAAAQPISLNARPIRRARLVGQTGALGNGAQPRLVLGSRRHADDRLRLGHGLLEFTQRVGRPDAGQEAGQIIRRGGDRFAEPLERFAIPVGAHCRESSFERDVER